MLLLYFQNPNYTPTTPLPTCNSTFILVSDSSNLLTHIIISGDVYLIPGCEFPRITFPFAFLSSLLNFSVLSPTGSGLIRDFSTIRIALPPKENQYTPEVSFVSSFSVFSFFKFEVTQHVLLVKVFFFGVVF